ncbi:hypothetical protein [Thiocapsa marina]|uniref:Uncharacterized protein n=1 Tax=Thiocapsa marina 5811 TaxID=768671 RepID=F9UEM2_9GAMM|nr:hypothetical protein [Thiocapsa marina]EGV17343.1 hypothetical protein ThimaDRAFT_3375 [Thiocapsa marina 5811]
MRNDLKLPRLYKTLLMLALVFGPFYWLAFTEDGQRRTDLALMFLLGKPELNAALDAFTGVLTEAQIRETFPKLEFQCADGANPFGDRLCAAEIGAFNGVPASSVTLFLVGDELRAVKVSYRRIYHPLMRDWVEGRVVRADGPRTSEQMEETGDGVATWTVSDGLLIMRDGELAPEDDPALFWLSRAALARQAAARAMGQAPLN